MNSKQKPAAGGVRQAGLNQYTQAKSSTASLRSALRWRQHSPADALNAGCRWHCERVMTLRGAA